MKREESSVPMGASNSAALGPADAFAAMYGELRAVAQRFLMNERRGHTLQATALVHEAYLRLAGRGEQRWKNRSQFLVVAAETVRRILVDHARRRQAARRGGRWQRVEVEEASDLLAHRGVDLLELDDALCHLTRLSERQGRIVVLRFFGGLTIEEVAEALGLSARTVNGQWSMARAWLRLHLSGGDRR